MTDEPDERYLTTCHEAGHVVAALMRGGELTSVTVDPTPEHARDRTVTWQSLGGRPLAVMLLR